MATSRKSKSNIESEAEGQRLRVAVDTGGTFTDCVWVERGRIRMLKVFSTPQDPSKAILEALTKTGAEAVVLLHGTTVGTNTLLERKGARVAFVTTAEFEDVIEIGRQARPKLYDFFFDKVEPLVSPELRFGVEERVDANGAIVCALKPEAVAQLRQRVRGSGAQAIAISLLFSFANPQHEREVADALGSLSLPISQSHVILPEFREFERASTVVVNAYLQPVMQRYLENLQSLCNTDADQSKPHGGSSIFVMQSSGGITSLESASREPVRTVLSGPAGGVVGASAMARRSGVDRIISFDMGGTSTDVALVDGDPHATNEAEVAGLPVRVPMLDIHTVGAGGGSVARFDAAGALRVGPASAGADPGPICYGRGLEPTVTDANLLLGRLRPDNFLGGDFRLDVERTRSTLTEWLHKHNSRMTIEQFAAGVVRVVNSTMEKAIRVVSIERGYDPRDFTLVAFGGAGGLHACELAAALGIPRVIVPALPGALSAYGILVSDVVRDHSRTLLKRVSGGKLDAAAIRELNAEIGKLQKKAEEEFRQESWEGNLEHAVTADVRYRGQGFELNVPFGPRMIASFHDEHNRRYGYSNPEREIEIVTLRVRTRLRVAAPATKAERSRAGATSVRQGVFFDEKLRPTMICDRSTLQVGKRYSGPAIVTEYSATTVVPPGSKYVVDRAGNLTIHLR